jgi:hypothetical protein
MNPTFNLKVTILITSHIFIHIFTYNLLITVDIKIIFLDSLTNFATVKQSTYHKGKAVLLHTMEAIGGRGV